MLLKLFV